MAAAPPRNRNDGNAYEGGVGVGGKFRKRPLRRATHTTPYDRPLTAAGVRNNGSGWLSRLVDPAQRLIASSAHRLFASVFRKRLAPPPPPPQQHEQGGTGSSKLGENEVKLEAGIVHQDDPDMQTASASGAANASNSSDRAGVIDLELILKQKTFTRSEIDRLITVLQSKLGDFSSGNEENIPGVISSKQMVSKREDFQQTPARDNVAKTPILNTTVLDDDVASPTELAKAYMGSRPSKVSPSMLRLGGKTFDDSNSPVNHLFPSQSPKMAIVPSSGRRNEFPENGFLAPMSRGRSAIYTMARAPYSRAQSHNSVQGVKAPVSGGEPSSSTSHSGSKTNLVSDSKQGSLKRRSSIFDNDMGSAGAIRRIRQKSNLLPAYGALSLRGTAVGSNTSQHPFVKKNPASGGELSIVNRERSNLGTSSTIPSKSIEMASKILNQLDSLVSSREKLPAKLSIAMLSGPALKSLEHVDSSKFLENIKANNKLDTKHETLLPHAQESKSQKHDKVEENGPTKFMVQLQSAPIVNVTDAVNARKSYVENVQTTAIPENSSAKLPSQKKHSFKISAFEDDFEFDDDDDSYGTVSASLTDTTKEREKILAATNTKLTEAPKENFPVILEANQPASSMLNQGTDSTAISKKTAFPEANGGIPLFSFREKAASPKKQIFPSSTSSPNYGKIADGVPPVMFASTSAAVTDSIPPKIAASSELQQESANSLKHVASDATEAATKKSEQEKHVHKDDLKPGFVVKSPEVIPSTLPSSFPATGIFSFGSTSTSTTLNNGILSSTLPFSPPSLVATDDIIAPNSSSNLAKAAGDSGRGINETANATSCSNNATIIGVTTTSVTAATSIPVSTSAPLFGAGTVFKFGSTVAPSTPSPSVSLSSTSQFTEAKTKETSAGNVTSAPSGTTTTAIASTSSSVSGATAPVFTGAGSTIFGGTSSVMASTGSSIFSGIGMASTVSSLFSGKLSAISTTGTGTVSFTAATTPATTSQSQGSSLFSSSSSHASAAGSGSTSTHSMPIQFGSSSSFGLNGSTSFSSSNTVSSSSTSTTKLFSTGPTFGLTSPSSSDANTVSSSSGTVATSFGSNWQAPKPTLLGSSSSAASSAGIVFGASSASNAVTSSAPMVFGSSTTSSSAPTFSFGKTSPATSSLTAFGNSSPVSLFGSSPSANGDQMNMEDSMAEDTVQTTTPTAMFNQQPPPASGFVFGSTTPSAGNQFGSTSTLGGNTFGSMTQGNPFGSATPSGGNQFGAAPGATPFQFGGQLNMASPQNPSQFQASGSLDFSAGGSFSLGADDKSNRRIVRIRKTQRKR